MNIIKLLKWGGLGCPNLNLSAIQIKFGLKNLTQTQFEY